MKIIGFNAGQFGDLAMQTICCRSVKRLYPNSKVTFAIGNKYESCKDLFLNQDFIDDIHIWDSYNEWPNQNDIQYLKNSNYDLIYNAMPATYPNWYDFHHQVDAVCLTHGLPIISNQLYLNKWFETDNEYSDYVSLAGFTSFGDQKNISITKLNKIIAYIKNKYNLKVLNLIGPNDPTLKDCENFHGSYFESVKLMLSTKFLISLDTGLIWYASCYNHPALGLYGYDFYPCKNMTSKNWQPVNQKAIYLENNHPENIDINLIYNKIDELCKNTI
jgi:ADP-heptose:LPS heptosyltransferase